MVIKDELFVGLLRIWCLALSGVASNLPLDERMLVVVQGLFDIDAADPVATDDEAKGIVEKIVLG